MVRSISGADSIPDILSSHTASLAEKATQGDLSKISIIPSGLVNDGVTDNTTAVQNAINTASGVSGDAYSSNTIGGTVLLPAGKFKMSGVILHSGVKLKGVRGSTWIIPDSTKDDYAIKTTLYSTTTRHEAIGIEDIGFTSNPTSPINGTYTNGQLGNGIYLGSGNGADTLKNVTMFGLNIGLQMQNNFDTKLSTVEFIGCNRNMVLTTSVAEVTNAIDLLGVRTELGVTSNLEIYDYNPNAKSQNRSIQVLGGKFEMGKIFVAGARDVKFIGPNFVWSSPTSDYMFVPASLPPGVTQAFGGGIGQTDMIAIVGASFQSGSGLAKFIDNRNSGFTLLLSDCTYTALDNDAFIGRIHVVGGTVIAVTTTPFNVPYLTGVQKSGGCSQTIPIRKIYTQDDQNFFDCLYNTTDGAIDATFKFGKSYTNTSGKIISLHLNLALAANAGYQVILNGNNINTATPNASTAVQQHISFLIPPGGTIFIGAAGTITVQGQYIQYL